MERRSIFVGQRLGKKWYTQLRRRSALLFHFLCARAHWLFGTDRIRAFKQSDEEKRTHSLGRIKLAYRWKGNVGFTVR